MNFLKKKILITLALLFTLTLPLNQVLAADQFKNGYTSTAISAGFTRLKFSNSSLPQVISLFITIVLSIVGVLFLGLMIYGGFVWMNAKGNESETKRAMSIIRNAAIGIIIVLAAYAITTIVYNVFDQTAVDVSTPQTE